MTAFKFNLKNSKLKYPLLITAIVAGACFLWYQQVFAPIHSQIISLKKDRDNQKDTLRTIMALKPQLNTLKEDLNRSENTLDSLKSMFPDNKEIPKLIREITGVARASGITATKFNPLADVEREYYIENRYNITVSGTYHNLANFFAFLANFQLIINLSTVSILANPENQPQEGVAAIETEPETIVSSFEMTTFSSKK
ncbi:MAG: type 4a pilus biogenesis protein PilO [Chitinispirillaceae bacterium]|nr:type 4a pilus biogenesis protein PilO [Chitinispirillaceae bacterium]